MRFLHLHEVQEQYPNHYSGLIKVTDLTDVELGTHVHRLKHSIGDSVASQSIQSACDLWRRVFAKMGAKPKYRSSLEALFSYYMQEGTLYSINDIVDFYNHYSLVHAMPMGAYDYNRFVGELKLSVIGKGKMFHPLGKVKSAQTTKDLEVAYSDNEKVICRYWNLQDCDETKITNVTKDVLFIFDMVAGAPEAATGRYEQIAREYADMFGQRVVAPGLTGQGIMSELEI